MPRTVIVVGAGASKEVGLPVGDELKQHIAKLLDIRFEDFSPRLKSGHPRIVEALRRHIAPDRDINPHRHAACRIAAAMPQAISIDNFIDAHRGDSNIEICGKLAIVEAILAAERKSAMYYDPTKSQAFPHSRVVGTWFNSFFQLLTENCRADDLEDRLSQVTLIVFNYDRCIEHFLYHALQTYYGMTAVRAGDLVKKIHIFHPYGNVGVLPWCGSGARMSVFGSEANSSELLTLAAGIKTFTEGTDPSSSDIVALREKVISAEKMLFLGFAFHRLNLELLWDKTKPPEPSLAWCFATGAGISRSDAELIKGDLIRLGRLREDRITIRTDLKCAELFPEYRRSLSLL